MPRAGTVPIVIFASLMIMGGGDTAYHAITDQNEAKPLASPVQYHDYITPGWQATSSPNHYALWSLTPSATSSTGMHIRAPHLNMLHGGLLHHNRIGGYWSRRAFRGVLHLFG
jgi:hypothetical protein